MSSIEIHPSHQINGGLLTTVLEVLQAFANRIVHGRQLYRDYLHLSAMSDPELQDIGISRSDILAVVAGTYRRAERPLVTPRKRPKANAGIEVIPTGNNSQGDRRGKLVFESNPRSRRLRSRRESIQC
jgi:uncharacterized protein YjiS (DUF1127 family)